MKILSKIGSALLMIGTLFCSGCVKDYTTEDALNYVKKQYNLRHVKALDDGIEQEGSDGYTDTLWTMYDEDYDITFHVLDDVFYGMESVANTLRTDYEDQVFLKMAKTDPNLEYISEVSDGMNYVCISGSFKTRNELKQVFVSLNSVYEDLVEQGLGDLAIGYQIKYKNPLRYTIDRYEIDDGDPSGLMNYLAENDLTYFEEKYLRCALDYNFVDSLSEFTEEEINSFIETDEDVKHILRVDDVGTYLYDDITASQYGYGISFGTLYEILVKEGFEVNGDSNQYSFVGVDNSIYEISYSFVEDQWYYYKKDDEKIRMRVDFYNHFDCGTIEEFTGLKLQILYDIQDYKTNPSNTEQTEVHL